MVYQIKLKKGYPYILAMLMLASCSAGKYAATNKVYKKKAGEFAEAIKSMPPVGQGVVLSDPMLQSWVGSVNFGIRRPNFVVLHHTAQKSSDQTVKTFTIAKTEVSAHYVVGRDGKVIQMVNDYLRANHAGVGKWGNDTDLNSSSIGIEIDNSGTEPYSEVQLQSLMTLLSTLKSRYKIPTANFIGHSDLAPRRKVDPANFPWKRFAEKGYGLWYDSVLVMPPDNFDATLALKIIGYDVSNLPAAIVAFKIHFVQTDVTPELTPAVKLILFNLYKKYM